MAQRSIFLPDDNRGDENRLTFNWVFMLNQFPELGQAFCDHLADASGLARSTFQSAIDHPSSDRGSLDYPDMLLVTRDWQVLFEHKLDAPCDNDQLRRYRAVAANRPGTRLAFMAPDPWEIAPDVLDDPLYLRPRDASHFYWSDVYPLVASERSHAASHLLHYFDELGFCPENWGGIGDPFRRGNERARQLVTDVRVRLTTLGWPARRPQNSHWDAIEVRRPLPHVHLGYMKLKRTMGRMEPRVVGQAVEFIVWTTPVGEERLLPRVTGRLQGEGPPIFVRPDWPNRTMPRQHKGELYFTTPMHDALGNSYESAIDGLTAFADRVLTYVRDGGTVVDD